jgi:uncharacterized protein with HEPN domain
VKRSADEALGDILIAAEDAAAIVDRGRASFDEDRLLQRAAKNVVAEIGEAAKALPEEVTDRIPGVPWRAIKGMRAKVVHDYPEVDLDVLWSTLSAAVPDLASRVRAYQAPGG